MDTTDKENTKLGLLIDELIQKTQVMKDSYARKRWETHIRTTFTPQQSKTNRRINRLRDETFRIQDEIFRIETECNHILDQGHEQREETGEHSDIRLNVTLHQQCQVCGKEIVTQK